MHLITPSLTALLFVWGCTTTNEPHPAPLKVVSPAREAPVTPEVRRPTTATSPTTPFTHSEELTHDPEKGCIELKPPGIALSDAKAYLDEGEPEWAIKECVDGLESGEKGCHEVLARAYEAQGNVKLTCHHVREALKFTPHNKALKALATTFKCTEHNTPR